MMANSNPCGITGLMTDRIGSVIAATGSEPPRRDGLASTALGWPVVYDTSD